MKKFKTLTKEWNLLDDCSELFRKRLTPLKVFILQAFENDDHPTIDFYDQQFKDNFKKQDWYNLAIAHDNYITSCKKPATIFENFDFAFSMICLREGEDQRNIDDNFHKEKLQEMFEDGLTSDVAGREVLNFMKHCPLEFRNFVGIVQLMTDYYSQKK